MKPVIYQVLPRLFGNRNPRPIPDGDIAQNGCGKFAAFSSEVLEKIRNMGFTHIWFTGVLEHATQTAYPELNLLADPPEVVKGLAGSPYAIRDYKDVDPDLADNPSRRILEFAALVRRTHEADLKVIIDFVPNHVSPSNTRFGPQNFHYQPDSEQRVSDYDWSDTVKLNYDNRDTWHKMRDILLFWAKFNVDGFRCDMVEMVPVAFWEWVVPIVKAEFPDLIFIAEVYGPQQYREYLHRGHFDYLYDKVGLYDTLRGVITGYASAQAITPCWQSVEDIQPHMLNFLENHDEQRIASDFFIGDPRRGRPALVVSSLLNVNPFLVYFGQELGERGMDAEGFSGCDGRTTIYDYWSLPVFRAAPKPTADAKALRQYYSTVLRLCNEQRAISEGLFYDLMYVNLASDDFNPDKQYAFLRYAEGELLLIVANFDGRPVDVRVQIPAHAFECFGIKGEPTITQASNLLTQSECSTDLKVDDPYPLSIPANDAVVIRFTLDVVEN
jgi:glycosidase